MEISQEILHIAEAIGREIPVLRIYLFGSYANGTAREGSDIDLFLLLPDEGLPPLDAALKARRVLSSIDRKTPVDILADYLSRFEERKNLNTPERKVWSEGVVLYERA